MDNFTAFAGLTIVSILAGIMVAIAIWDARAKRHGEHTPDTDEH